MRAGHASSSGTLARAWCPVAFGELVDVVARLVSEEDRQVDAITRHDVHRQMIRTRRDPRRVVLDRDAGEEPAGLDARLRGKAQQTARALTVIDGGGRDDEHREVERREQRVERCFDPARPIAQTIDHFPVRLLPVTLPSAASFNRWACTE